MPRIISFAWTAPALLAGHKTVTRRDWDITYGLSWRAGQEAQAYDRSPRLHGVPIALLRIDSVTRESSSVAPDSDYEAEGLKWLWEHQDQLPKTNRRMYLESCSRFAFDQWRRSGVEMWVVRFTVLAQLRQGMTVAEVHALG